MRLTSKTEYFIGIFLCISAVFSFIMMILNFIYCEYIWFTTITNTELGISLMLHGHTLIFSYVKHKEQTNKMKRLYTLSWIILEINVICCIITNIDKIRILHYTISCILSALSCIGMTTLNLILGFIHEREGENVCKSQSTEAYRHE